MTACYIQPGMPPPTPQAPCNAYIQPSGPLQQTPLPSPQRPTLAHDQPRHGTLFHEWRLRHANTWVKADDLNPAVRRMIDAKDRTAAIRQKLRQLAHAHPGGFTLESKVVGNAARPVTLYRAVEVA